VIRHTQVISRVKAAVRPAVQPRSHAKLKHLIARVRKAVLSAAMGSDEGEGGWGKELRFA